MHEKREKGWREELEKFKDNIEKFKKHLIEIEVSLVEDLNNKKE